MCRTGNNVYKQSADGIDVSLAGGTLSILPMADNTMRIRFFKDSQPKDTELIFIKTTQKPVFEVTGTQDALLLRENIDIEQTGTLSFADNTGEVFLREKEETRKLVPESVGGNLLPGRTKF